MGAKCCTRGDLKLLLSASIHFGRTLAALARLIKRKLSDTLGVDLCLRLMPFKFVNEPEEKK